MVSTKFIVHTSLKAHTFAPAHFYIWDNFVRHIIIPTNMAHSVLEEVGSFFLTSQSLFFLRLIA